MARTNQDCLLFKKRFDQQLTTRKVKKEGVLILNRTLLSRLSLLTECPIPLQPPLSVADLYERKMDYQALTPDIIFNLVASKKELISRLDPRDVKYNFRKHVIEKKSNLYLDMVGKFTEEIRSRIITISTENVPKEEIAQIIFKTVQDKLLLLSHS